MLSFTCYSYNKPWTETLACAWTMESTDFSNISLTDRRIPIAYETVKRLISSLALGFENLAMREGMGEESFKGSSTRTRSRSSFSENTPKERIA